MPEQERTRKLALHNLHLLRKEVLLCKEAISEGRLWDLVEERAAVHPRLSHSFAEFATRGEEFRSGTAFLKDRGLMIRSIYDLKRPELLTAREHLADAIHKSSDVAVLITSGENRPLMRQAVYRKILRRFRNERTDVYRIHQQLGPFPSELEFVYPLTQTVQRKDRLTKRVVEMAIRKLKQIGYKKIIRAS